MEPTDRQLLLSLRQTLTERLPYAGDPRGARALSMCRIALDELLHRDDRRGREEEMVSELRSRVDRGNALIDSVSRIAATESLDLAGLRGAVAALTTQILAARSRKTNNRDWVQVSTDWLSEAVTAEATAAQRDALGAAAPAAVQLPLAASVKQREGYFRDRLGEGSTFRIEGVTELSGGFSNETVAVSAVKNGAPMKFVVRRARPVGIMEPYVASLQEEYPFLELLHANQFPVPQPLLLETDGGVLGQPFIVTAFTEGSNMRAGEPINDGLWQAFASRLAQLHAVPWQDSVQRLPSKLAPGAAMTTTDSVVNMLERLKQYWDISTLDPSPALEVLFDWLLRNKSTVTGPPVITHGDLGFHNMLCQGDRISAFLDWETVILCSPIKDLQTMRDEIVPAEVWPRFVHWYTEAGGVSPDPEHFHYYRMLRLFQGLSCTCIALEKMFVWADPLNIEFLELGIPARALYYRRTRDTLTALLRNEGT